MKISVKTFAVLSVLASAIAGTSTWSSAEEKSTPFPETMHEYMGMQGYGMMNGYGSGYAMGPGAMMGGYGGGYGMGPGMGMMGGWTGGMGPFAMLDLSDAQNAQIEKIQTESRKKQRTLMRQMWDDQEKLGDLIKAEKRDPTAIGKAYIKLSDLQRQMLEANIEVENKMTAVLTKEQKAQMRRGYRRGMMGY
jgi:Spy/CpxP family protein refolding chaperone